MRPRSESAALLLGARSGYAEPAPPMRPMLLAWLPASPRVHFLGRRSAIHNRRWKRWVLGFSGGAIPVESGEIRHVSDAVQDVLRRGGVVGIFPEGGVGPAAAGKRRTASRVEPGHGRGSRCCRGEGARRRNRPSAPRYGGAVLELTVDLSAEQVLRECERRGLVVRSQRGLGSCEGGRHWHLRIPGRAGTLELNDCRGRISVKVHPRRDGGWARALAAELHAMPGPPAPGREPPGQA